MEHFRVIIVTVPQILLPALTIYIHRAHRRKSVQLIMAAITQNVLMQVCVKWIYVSSIPFNIHYPTSFQQMLTLLLFTFCAAPGWPAFLTKGVRLPFLHLISLIKLCLLSQLATTYNSRDFKGGFVWVCFMKGFPLFYDFLKMSGQRILSGLILVHWVIWQQSSED